LPKSIVSSAGASRL